MPSGMDGMDYCSRRKAKTPDPIHDLSPHVRRGGILPPQIGRIISCKHLLGIRENR